MTIPRLAERVGRSRTLLHRLAANPDEGWPEPTYRPGSTRPEYDVAWFDEYWAQRQAGIKQGKRTDLAKKKQGEPAVSGYRNSGMTREDYEAREKLYDMAVFIEERWPGQHPVLCRDLRDLGDTVSEESEARDG
jgi:hypothetical protein